MSLYTLDGNTRRLLSLSNFEAPDFSVRSFIEQLSGSRHELDEDERLDPKPFIRTFELAAGELERLLEVAIVQEEATADRASELTETRNLEVQDVAAQVKECVQKSKELDEIASEVQQVSGPLGHKLERLSLQHEQISNYRLLTTAYLSFLNGQQPAELTRMWNQDMRRCAKFVAQLQALATAIGATAKGKDAQAQIDKFAENLENQLLANFLNSYQNFDLKGMRESADILTDFNGGGAVTQAYINQHRFFMNVDQLQGTTEASEGLGIWEHLSDYQSEFGDFEAVVEKAVLEIGDTISRETEIITRVFPLPGKVLELFIQRTFAQKIQELVNGYVDEARDRPPIARCRVLAVCYARVNQLVITLEKNFSDSELRESEKSDLSYTLELNLKDAFDLGEYFDLEITSLKLIINNELRSQEVGSASVEDGTVGGIFRKAMRNLTHDETDESETGTPPAESQESSVETRWSRLQHMPTETVQNVLAAFGEAIAREQIVRTPDLFAHDALMFYNLLTRELGGRLISTTIDGALAHSIKIEAKQPVNWSFLQAIKTSGHALRLLAAFVKTVLFAMVQDHPQTEKNMADALNSYIVNVQRSCLQLVEQAADLMHMRTQFILGKNSKRDYIDPPGGAAGAIISAELLKELSNLSEASKLYLSTHNSQSMMKVVATNLCADLLQNVRMHTISMEGGAVLGNDIAKIEEFVLDELSSSPEVTDQFATLKALTKLFSSEQSLISSLLRDSHLSKLPQSELRVVLEQRSDNTGYRFTSYI